MEQNIHCPGVVLWINWELMVWIQPGTLQADKCMLLILYLKCLIATKLTFFLFFLYFLQAGALDLLKELKNIPMTLELLQVWFSYCCYVANTNTVMMKVKPSNLEEVCTNEVDFHVGKHWCYYRITSLISHRFRALTCFLPVASSYIFLFKLKVVIFVMDKGKVLLINLPYI